MTRRDRIVLTVLGLAAVLAGFWFVALAPKRTELARLDERADRAAQRRDAALSDLASVAEAKVAFRRDRATLALLGKAVPADDDTPSLLYQLHRAARRTGVTFRALEIGAAGTAPAAAAPAATPAKQGDGKDASATPPPAAAPAPVTPGTAPGATPETAGMSTLPVKITFTGDFLRLRRFLDVVHGFTRSERERVDVRGRLLTVDSVALKPSPRGLPALSAEILANAYVAPAMPVGTAGTEPATAGTATTVGATTTGAIK
jgi:Tfp pilus assembly protein PilO